MNPNRFVSLRPGVAIPRIRIPESSRAEFQRTIVDATAAGQRIAALFADVAGGVSGELSDAPTTHHSPLTTSMSMSSWPTVPTRFCASEGRSWTLIGFPR
jgi:hypothetical protein